HTQGIAPDAHNVPRAIVVAFQPYPSCKLPAVKGPSNPAAAREQFMREKELA
ncbi:uncharacterized protein BDR25DRAFT_190788, partial [Lindgomyces ingoldianus]